MNNQTGDEDLRKPLAHVLVVDDDDGIRRNFRSGLEDLGYAVVVAAEGREGLDAFAGGCFDIVMVDLWMPVMNGMEFIAALKKQSPLTPVVVVSGSGTLHDALQAIHLGAWDYVVKPVEEVEELDLVLRRNLDRARLLAENQRHREQLEELVVERTHKLQESEQRLRALSDNLPDSLVYQIVREHDGTMRFIHVSAGVERLNGVTAETVVRDPSALYSQIVEEDRPMVAAAEQDSLKTMGVFNVVARMRRADGQLRWMHLCSAPRRLDDGRILWDGIQTDITERHQAEIALKQSEERFSRIFKTSPMPITLRRLADGRIIDANEGFLRMSGFTREEVVGHTSLELGLYQDTSQRQILMEQLRKHGHLHGHEVRLRTKSGQTRDIVVWIDLISIHGEECMLAIATDVTEHKRAEDALRFSEERFRSAMQHSAIGMAMVSLDGRWLEVNPALCRIVGYTREELLARDFQSITHPDDLEANLEYARQMLAREIETYQMEKRYLHKDGHVVWGQLNVSLLRDADGKPRHFVSQIQDISGRKQAEEARKSLEIQLRQAQKMESLGTLAGGIAHDFNNILGAILGNVELARSDVGADPVVQESLAAIGKAAHRARDLVRQILAFSRQQAPELRPVKLATVVDDAVRLLRATLPAAVEIRTHLDMQCPNIQADPTQLHQIIMNLGINSWHAMVEGAGTIDISVKNFEVDVALSATHADLKPGPYVSLSVADNGKGMDETTLGRIFDPFFTTKAPGEGTGLGLAVAHGIMKNHHGAIRAESQPGKGTTLFLYFPAASANVEVAEAVEAAEAAPANVSVGEGQHILYVDDEAPLVRLVAILLERSGYRVSGFTNADEALAAFRAQPGQFSLLITDLNMPGMSGFEVASEVHRLRPELRTVVVSGYVTEELLKEALACGVSEIIQKPYTFQDMGESIQRLLSKSN